MPNKESEQSKVDYETKKTKSDKPWYKKKRVMIPLTIIVLIIFAAMGGDDSDKNNSSTTKEAPVSSEKKATVDTDKTNNDASKGETKKTPSLSAQQENAVKSAESYIAMSGFSKLGLIGQLSSEYGDKYPVKDATAAVNSLNLDYNEQAKRSAESYLDMSGFSCQGLIDQLSSDAGDKYTVKQATAGAKAAGAC